MDLSILRAILERWSIDPGQLIADNSEGLNTRIKVQKMMYLLQNRMYHADVLYSYGMYLHGPYSPELSRDYYQISSHAPNTSDSASGTITNAGLVLDDLNTFAQSHSQITSVEAAELLGTTLYFIKRYRTAERAAQAVYTVKPKLKDKPVKIEEVISFLSERGYLRGSQAA